MNYNNLEACVRRAACKTLGARSEGFDSWLVTCDPNEGMGIDDFDLGTDVELSFDPSISPLSYFSSDVVFSVNLNDNGIGAVQVVCGSACRDTASAEMAAETFGQADGWYIASDFDEEFGLHMVHTFACVPEDDGAAEDAIASCFAKLLENKTADKLRSFIHYFED